MIVGGNIDGVTRVITTAIALETSKGDLPLALALGVVLLSVVLLLERHDVPPLSSSWFVRAKSRSARAHTPPTPLAMARGRRPAMRPDRVSGAFGRRVVGGRVRKRRKRWRARKRVWARAAIRRASPTAEKMADL